MQLFEIVCQLPLNSAPFINWPHSSLFMALDKAPKMLDFHNTWADIVIFGSPLWTIWINSPLFQVDQPRFAIIIQIAQDNLIPRKRIFQNGTHPTNALIGFLNRKCSRTANNYPRTFQLSSNTTNMHSNKNSNHCYHQNFGTQKQHYSSLSLITRLIYFENSSTENSYLEGWQKLA